MEVSSSIGVNSNLSIGGGEEEGIVAYVEPFVILVILVLNAMIAVWQDTEADKALDALNDLQAVECKLLRDGEWTIQNAKNLVSGDIVEVKIGDRIPADIRILKLVSVSLQIEEAPLTGESVSV